MKKQKWENGWKLVCKEMGGRTATWTEAMDVHTRECMGGQAVEEREDGQLNGWADKRRWADKMVHERRHEQGHC